MNTQVTDSGVTSWLINALQVQDTLQWFAYDHLREELQAISKPFHDLAHQIAEREPQRRQTLVALERLLEAKDAAVRAAL